MIDPNPIRERFSALGPHLRERERRLFAASEARAAGYGGIAAVGRDWDCCQHDEPWSEGIGG
jgi:hypothetical protein